MPLFHGYAVEIYVLRGSSHAVKTLLQTAGFVKSGQDADAGWDRLVRGLVRRTRTDAALASDGEAGILSPGVCRTSLDTQWDSLGLRVPPLRGQIDIAPDRSARGQVAVILVQEADDALFAKLLATAIFFLPEERFLVWHEGDGRRRDVKPELLLSRYLLEAGEKREAVSSGERGA